MGMTDKQFASYRRQQLEEYEDMLEIAEKTKADTVLIKKIKKAIEKAKADIEV
ncbi:MAG: hypothetical protein FWH08_00330 [Oscillospiraceae bacterium]|nr:hypothetical protein [Oscillospiraceae bacterium]